MLKGRIEASTIQATSDWVQGLAEEFGFTHEDLYRVDLCLSELVTNVVSYAQPQFDKAPLEIHASIDEQRAALTLIDPAQPFDPLSVPPPAVALTIDALQIGGRGVHLVRSFCDDWRYERSQGCNRLELVFNRAPSPPAPHRAARVPRGAERRQGGSAPVFPLGLADGTSLAKERRTPPDRRALGFLSRLRLFRGLSYAALEDRVSHWPILTLAAQTLVLERGVRNHQLLVVLDGAIQVSLEPPGVGQAIEIGAGECVGEMSIIDAAPASAYGLAMAGTRLLLIDEASFLGELMAMPQVARNLMSALATRMRRSDAELIERVRKEMQAEQARRELEFARNIQASLLPQAPILPDEPRVSCVGRMCSAREVGGDFYDIFRLGDSHIFFVIADVCGKGLPAALFMVRAVAALRAQSVSHDEPARYVEQVAMRLNEQLCGYNEARQFLTAFCGVVDLRTLAMHYVNAGHNPPVLAQGDGVFGYLSEPINPIVGMIDGLVYRAGHIQLSPRSVLLLYTDGVSEAENTAGDMLGEDRLLACVQDCSGPGVGDLVEAVFAETLRFSAGAPQSDDITVLAIRF